MSIFDVSDGFIVDNEPPLTGSVYSSSHYKDTDHQWHQFRTSWVGFSDVHSFVSEYLYAVGKPGETPEFQSAGFQNHITRNLQEFNHGEEYIVYVQAVDAAGHHSDTVTSSVTTIDLTPPGLLSCGETSTIFDEELSCFCGPVVRKGHLENCQCNSNNTVETEIGSLYEVTVITWADPGHDISRLEVGSHAEWVLFHHVKHNGTTAYEFITLFVSQDDVTASPVLLTSDDADSFVVRISQCGANNSSGAAFTKPQLTPQAKSKSETLQFGYDVLQIKHPFHDPESSLKSIQVGIGTNKGGFQLLPLTKLGIESATSFQLPLRHNMQVFTTCIATNNAGQKTIIESNVIIVDWTAPIVRNVTSFIRESEPNVYDVIATWDVSDAETEITWCYWHIGLTPESEDLLSYRPTESLTSSFATVNMYAQSQVFVTITCVNRLNFKGKATVNPVSLLADPPSSDGAVVDIIPQQYTYFPPRHSSQSKGSEVAFSYSGFKDLNNVDYYQYLVQNGGSETEWVSVGKQDYVLVWDIALPETSLGDISVRSVDNSGVASQPVTGTLYIDGASPRLTGETLSWELSGATLTINWFDVFVSEIPHGVLKYQVFIGAEEGAANYVIGMETTEPEVTFTSPKLAPPSAVHCVVTAYTPAGGHVTYRETLYL